MRQSTPRFCTTCGTPRAVTDRFCSECGHALETPTAAPAPLADTTASLHVAQAHMAAGDYQGAGDALHATVAAHPDWAEALALLGIAELRQYHLAAAWDALDRAVQLAPDSIFVRLRLAEYWLALGVTPRAVTELERALRTAGDDQAGYLRAHLHRIATTHKGAFHRGGSRSVQAASLGT